jgi:hypothetical protein
VAVLLSLLAQDAGAWGGSGGHRKIRAWAVERLPDWQRERVGAEALERLVKDYSSLQDHHAGGKAPHLDAYCRVPGVARLSLHDVNPAEPSIEAKRWYLARIRESLTSGQTDEAMKFLGVLCHWNEDPGCPSAHCSPVTEQALRLLLPPPPDLRNLNYLYGYGGIADGGKARYEIPPEDYRPRLLGSGELEAAVRIYQHQRLLERAAAADIVPLAQAVVAGDDEAADRVRARAALRNARHVADLIYTVFCLALDRIEPGEAGPHSTQALEEWLPEHQSGSTSRPYTVTPFLIGQAMDARRALHPLAFPGQGDDARVASGLSMGTPFALPFPVAPGGLYERFTCRAGLHPAAGKEGRIIFVVEVNGKPAHTTPPVSAGDPPVPVEVPLPREGFITLTLRTLADEGSDATHNIAVWAEPKLHRTDGSD